MNLGGTLHFVGIKRSDRDARLRAKKCEEKMTTIRQEIWVTVPVSRVRFGDRLWHATRGRNLKQTTGDEWRKHNHPVPAPRSPFQSVSVTKRLRTPARQINPLQLTLRAEAQRTTVRRPERR